jgi:hypothetical protein
MGSGRPTPGVGLRGRMVREMFSLFCVGSLQTNSTGVPFIVFLRLPPRPVSWLALSLVAIAGVVFQAWCRVYTQLGKRSVFRARHHTWYQNKIVVSGSAL